VREQLALVERDGGATVGAWRDPLGGHWQALVVLPLERVEPTPFQRDLSPSHVERLGAALAKLDRFLDPIIVVRRSAGGYWTPNGSHRLAAMRALGARAITALLVPEEQLAYEILALDTEKAHNLRERSLEVIRMVRDLARLGRSREDEHAAILEEPAFVTLGICYERNGRFPGSLYHPTLKRIDAFLAKPLAQALATREKRADVLGKLEDAVAAAAAALKERGFESPYLKSFVMASIDPLRYKRGQEAEFDATLAAMLQAARRFDASKAKLVDLARSGGGGGAASE
jgi:ParB family chromosome partitioning protein